MKKFDLKLFTVGNLKDWLVRNQQIGGLTDEVISKPRAYSIIHNPYVKDEDAVVSAAFEEDVMVAYTAAFPELYKGRRIWWFSTLYCKPEYEGKGYGIAVVGSLAELYGENDFFDMEGAPETVEICKYLGLNVSYVKQYKFGYKRIRKNTIKGVLALVKQNFQMALRSHERKLIKQLKQTEYKVAYSKYIDDEAYAFIMKHRNCEAFPRNREFLNWILRYPFCQSSPLLAKTIDNCRFSSSRFFYDIYAVKVYSEEKLIGLYILRNSSNDLSVKYLYYEKAFMKHVFMSVLDHLVSCRALGVSTRNKDLADFIQPYNLFPKMRCEDFSFCYPKSFDFQGDMIIQGGDGDNFV